jgi:hypothetical protein
MWHPPLSTPDDAAATTILPLVLHMNKALRASHEPVHTSIGA